jgi:alkylated DNA nucleotide flippase Atl1
MHPEVDSIVDIPPERIKFFGCAGQMVLPGLQSVRRLIGQVPAGQLLTTDQVRQKLAEEHGVEATCPATLQKALRAIAKEPSTAFWRVIKKDGTLFSYLPGGAEAQAARLRAEGLVIANRRVQNPVFVLI